LHAVKKHKTLFSQENVKVAKDDLDVTEEHNKKFPEVSGLVEFQNVTARYPLRYDIILKAVSVQINRGEHVAVVGRTGSGKSSLILSLFRMLDTLDGTILIDGQDITKVPLSIHRSRLNIIPQVSLEKTQKYSPKEVL
jgi:ABC-type multidrug transport system fused ATPase/permease subunit